MKVAYIAHPIGGDVQGNLKLIMQIGRQINLEEPDTVPFAHYFFDCFCLEDDIPEERERGIRNDHALMRRGFIDEVRLYGDRISVGMRHEIALAVELGIPVVPMTEETRLAFAELNPSPTSKGKPHTGAKTGQTGANSPQPLTPLEVGRLIKKAHQRLCRNKGLGYAPTVSELQQEIDRMFP